MMLHARPGTGLPAFCSPPLSPVSRITRPSSHSLFCSSTCPSSFSSHNSHFNSQLRLPSRGYLSNTRSVTRDLVRAEVFVDGIDRATSSQTPGEGAIDGDSEELGLNERSSLEARNLDPPEIGENEGVSEFEGKRVDTGAVSQLGQVFSRKSKEEEGEKEEEEENADELIEQQGSGDSLSSIKLSDKRLFVKTRDVEGITAISEDLNETHLKGCESFANGTVLQSCEDMVMEREGIKSRNTGRRKLIAKRNLPKREYSDLQDERFMREALVEARKAAKAGEVPVGAVLVHKNDIIARHHNRVEADGDPTAHAEMLCIRSAAIRLGGWRLMDVTLYVTLEPCPMCAGAILQARVGQLVWGGRNSLLGADGSWIKLFPESASSEDYDADTIDRISLDREPKLEGRDYHHPFHRTIEVRRGLLARESTDLMQSFFQMRRLKTKKTKQVLSSNSTVWSRYRHMFPSILKKLNVMRQLFRM